MNELYYVPSLEEFHIGFEYELAKLNEWDIRISEDQTDFHWETKIFHQDNNTDFMFNTILAIGSIRVKYLNKDDFESLKFFQKREISTHYEYLKAIHTPAIIGKSFDVSILQDKHNPTKIMVFDVTLSKHSIFSGKIRNISELKVLLKQLGI